MTDNTPDFSTVFKNLDEIAAKKVKVAVTDIDGILRGKYVHRNKFDSAAQKGFGFCNVVFGWDCADLVYENTEYTGWHTGYPDAHAQIDLSSFRRIPWENGQPFFLADFVNKDGKPLEVCPRQLLKRIIEMGNSQNFEALVGMEFEWFNFKEDPFSLQEKGFRNMQTLTPGMFGYSILRASLNSGFFNQLMDDMREFDIPLEGLHTETGPGVYEAAIQVADPLEAADRAVLFKTAAKEIGYRHGVMPTFMAKWNPTLPGCSGHIHQSLNREGKNLFYNENDTYQMSDLFKSYLAGQLKYIPEILPFLAPNVNSFKRLVEGLWAPTTVNWGVENRTVAFRVIPGGSATRLETRVPGSDVNPYIAIAACMGAGLKGVEEGLKLETKPIIGNGYEDNESPKLPKTLIEATEKLSESSMARSLFGDKFVDHFVHTRIWEIKEFQKAVTDWELKRYFELI